MCVRQAIAKKQVRCRNSKNCFTYILLLMHPPFFPLSKLQLVGKIPTTFQFKGWKNWCNGWFVCWPLVCFSLLFEVVYPSCIIVYVLLAPSHTLTKAGLFPFTLIHENSFFPNQTINLFLSHSHHTFHCTSANSKLYYLILKKISPPLQVFFF